MNRERTREVIEKLSIPVTKSNGHGIEIHRSVAGDLERWRLYTGGGIAANSDKVWLSPIRRGPDGAFVHAARGPYWNKTQLEKALRAWRRGE